MSLHRATRLELSPLAVDVAPVLLGGELRTRLTAPDGSIDDVHIRITEVEAYHGHGTGDQADPGSHARMGRTPRNATMWGEPGHLYVYLSHGIHSCVNVVTSPEGVAGGILLRAGEVVAGAEAARARSGRSGRDLARGPGRLGQVSGLRHPRHDGINAIDSSELLGARAELWIPDQIAVTASGPRIGVAGEAGTSAFPWRFWLPKDPTVSVFRWGRNAAEAEARLRNHE